MDIEILGLLGFTLTAIVVGKMAYERRMDVLYGPYIRGRTTGRAGFSVKRLWKPGLAAIDRLRSLEEPRMVYLSSVAAC
jgi:hypothetical protein